MRKSRQMRLVWILAIAACSSSSPTTVIAPPPITPPDTAAVAPVADAAIAVATADASAAPRSPNIELTFVGDLMFGGYFDDHYDPQYVENTDPMVDIAPLLTGDLVLGNFETTIARTLPNNGGPHDGKGNKRFVTIPTRAAVIARDHRIHAVTLANNHALDNDAAGLVDTPKILGELGVALIGAARPADQPRFRVETLEVKGWKVGFIAATQQINRSPRKDGPQVPYVTETAIRAQLVPVIEAARKTNDLVIVVVHWGYEYTDAPARWQIDAAHAFVDAGADAVIGHHPHVLQGIERYRSGVIAYSLGNFVFPNAKERVRDTGVLHLGYARDPSPCLASIAFDPAFQIREPITHPIRAIGANRAEVGKRVSSLSAALSTTWDVKGDRFSAPAACK